MSTLEVLDILWDLPGHFESSWWFSVILQYLQGVNNGDTAVLH